jgi:cytoskeletal protein RodZ
MRIQHGISKLLALALAFGLGLTPEMFAQQQTQSPTSQAPSSQQTPQAVPPAASEPPASTTPAQTQPAKPSPNGSTIDPSQGPLQPVTTYPDASGGLQQEQSTVQTTNPPEAPQPKTQQPTQPVGAATAERVPTAGGAAAKPAGAAIAPAKQHQTRGLLIKIGAIAAAGAALGTVYALTRSTGSLPPGAR